MKKVENILIIGPWHLTQGMAPATRIIAYCKGLQQNNVMVDNIIYYPNKKGDGVPLAGNIDGVPYEYAYQRDTTKSALHRKIIDWPLSLIKVILLAIKRHRENKYDFIFLSFDYINMLFFFAPILNICGARIVFVIDEYPVVIRKTDSLVKLIKKYLRIKSNIPEIEFIGQLDGKNLVSEFLSADIYVSASHIENSPNNVCEAMVFGLPVIATNVGGVSSLLTNNKEGLLVQDGDPWSLAGAIKYYIENYDIAIQFGKSARTRALVRHNKERIVNSMLSIYTDIIKSE